MSLDSAPTSRILCAESGHWWSDHPFLVTTRNRQTFGERVQNCMRDGCERERVTRISLRDGSQIGGIAYRGRLTRIGRLTRTDLRTELVKRQEQV